MSPKPIYQFPTFNYTKYFSTYKMMQIVPHHRLRGTVSWNLLIKVYAINYGIAIKMSGIPWFGGSIRRLAVEWSSIRLSGDYIDKIGCIHVDV